VPAGLPSPGLALPRTAAPPLVLAPASQTSTRGAWTHCAGGRLLQSTGGPYGRTTQACSPWGCSRGVSTPEGSALRSVAEASSGSVAAKGRAGGPRTQHTHPLELQPQHHVCLPRASTHKSRCTDRVQAPQQACGGERRETRGVLTLLLRVVVKVDEAAVEEARRLWTGLGPLLTAVPPHHRQSGWRPSHRSLWWLPHRGLGQRLAKLADRSSLTFSRQVAEHQTEGGGDQGADRHPTRRLPGLVSRGPAPGTRVDPTTPPGPHRWRQHRGAGGKGGGDRGGEPTSRASGALKALGPGPDPAP
jgi:hypothetical protein